MPKPRKPILSGAASTEMNEAEQEAREFFEDQGFKLNSIPPNTQMTPDLQVKDSDGVSYLVEVKSRCDSDNFLRELNEVRRCQNGVISNSRKLGRDDKIERIIHEARNQLRAYDSAHLSFWLVWLSANELFSHDVAFERIVYTLYGSRHLIIWNEDNTVKEGVCHYAQRGAFEHWPEIDGVIISNLVNNRLFWLFCLNELSSRINLTRKHRLSNIFETHGALVVPKERVSLREFWLDIEGVDRKNDNQMIQYLRSRFNPNIKYFFSPIKFSALTPVPDPPVRPNI